jgi:hypothetical protein
MNTKGSAEDKAYELAKDKARGLDHAPRVKTYLGDGVYAEVDKFGDLVLTTENGVSAQHRVVLGPNEWVALNRFVGKQRSEP